ncbi:MAG: DUF805 domain-containing protein [Selenomonadaceae bacterium]|nr:DUF805 domain-containing protein [Selenomonadaceae bacterium]MBR4383943.1 DUF805 domain-containing protein [Selenomonadaceae bacterium]
MNEFKKFLGDCFTISGRLSRQRYAKTIFTICFPILVALILESLIVDTLELGARFPHTVMFVRVIMYSVTAFAWIAIPCLTARRLHDIGKSGWISWFPNLTLFVPIPGFWFLGTVFIWWLVRKDGDAGKNKYGDPPPDD